MEPLGFQPLQNDQARRIDCRAGGQIAHCLVLLGEGDKELAACAKTVQDTIASCTALRQMAAANFTYVAKLAGVVGDICKDCETECRKHEKKHSVCRDCAEACAKCAKECQKAAAA